MKCDNCGRAVLPSKATTFAKANLILCRRRECDTLAERAKDLYYNDEVNNLRGRLDL